MKTSRKPYSDTELVRFLNKRIGELKPRKSQLEISGQAGFRQPNMLANIKNGASRLPLDRVISLAEALECDPARLFQLAIEQQTGKPTRATIQRIFRVLVSENEAEWLEELREASGGSDPRLTSRARSVLRGVFGR
jgi:hypothetical protein